MARAGPPARCWGLLALALALALARGAAAYDPVDPTGNVTVVWDILRAKADQYKVHVGIHNWQRLRTVANWSLTWTWPGKEFIASARGAEATEQGNCKAISQKFGIDPHSCLKTPTVVDLPATDQPPVPGCCNSGLIRTALQDPATSFSAFEMDVANARHAKGIILPPLGLGLNAPGYTCSRPFEVAPMNHTSLGSRRVVQSFQTYNIVCSYRKPAARPTSCCVSFSAFYSPDVSPCRSCACACGTYSPASAVCIRQEDPLSGTSLVSDGGNDLQRIQDPNAMICSPDGCPVHIRFHVKANYEGYWKAKVTIWNRHFQMNYSDWNLVMEHPNMGNVSDTNSFNATALLPFGTNNTAAFWGLKYYNDWLVAAGPKTGPGLVQSELLFGKSSDFTLSGGWPFPKRVSFMGEECVMPETYPSLPNSSARHHSVLTAAATSVIALFVILLLL